MCSVETAKNGLVADLFDRLGFSVLEGAPGVRRYSLAVGLAKTPYSTLIEQVTAPFPALTASK